MLEKERDEEVLGNLERNLRKILEKGDKFLRD